jgi:hypothetical protein
LTAFIFEAQDYNLNNCSLNAPPTGDGFCARKKTMEAFTFLAFFFNFTGIIIEAYLLGAGIFGVRDRAATTEKTNPTNGTNGQQAAAAV